MPTDVLTDLAELPGVADAAGAARERIDELLWNRSLRPVAAELARQSALRGAWANAAMDGAEVPYESLRAGLIEDSPMGRQVSRAVAMTAELRHLVEIYRRSPMQAWARMHTLLVAGAVPPEEVGRPRSGMTAEDPLRLGPLPPPEEVGERLATLARLVVAESPAPGLVKAGVVHAELSVLRPFAHGSGLLARATTRLSLAAAGLDPDLLTIPESGLLAAGRARYVRALKEYRSGTADGLATWLTWFSGAVKVGAEQAAALGSELAG